MAPEQAKHGEQVTTASDVYALGSVLFTLLTGRAPYEGDTPIEILVSKVRDESPALPPLDRSERGPRPRGRFASSVSSATRTDAMHRRRPSPRISSSGSRIDRFWRGQLRPASARSYGPAGDTEIAALGTVVGILIVALIVGALASGVAVRRNLERALGAEAEASAAEAEASAQLRGSYVAQARGTAEGRAPPDGDSRASTCCSAQPRSRTGRMYATE